MKSTLYALLFTATAAYAQFALKIVSPPSQEFLQLGGTFPVDIQAPDVSAGTVGPNIQLSLCTEITGFPLCNNTLGRVLLNEPFSPPDQTYSITIPVDQQGGLTRLVAGHYSEPGGTPTLSDKTSIEVFLGSRI